MHIDLYNLFYLSFYREGGFYLEFPFINTAMQAVIAEEYDYNGYHYPNGWFYIKFLGKQICDLGKKKVIDNV